MCYVSLIVPIYNAEQYLRRCLDSIMQLRYRDMEVLLMNDGSTDNSLTICQEYAARDSRFLVVNKPNTGVSDTRNQAIALARGKYLQFCDSDDWMTEDATDLLVFAADYYDADLVISDFYRVDGSEFAEKQHIRRRGLLTRERFAEYMMEAPADYYYGVMWNKLYRKSIIEEHQLKLDKDIHFCEDFLFNLAFLRYANRITAIQNPIYYYMKRKGSLVSTEIKKANFVAFRFKLLKIYKELYQSMGLYEENKFQVNSFVLTFAKDNLVTLNPISKKRLKLTEDAYIKELPAGYVHVQHEIPAVYDDSSRYLILGSFPSVKSREGHFFYNHPQNRFWQLMARLMVDAVPETVEEKKAFLLRNRIAVWDVVSECDVKGSSDSSIKNVIPNDISEILERAPIREIITNGGEAHRLYEKYCYKVTGRKDKKCPSTSPANAAFSMDRLEEEWKKAIFEHSSDSEGE